MDDNWVDLGGFSPIHPMKRNTPRPRLICPFKLARQVFSVTGSEYLQHIRLTRLEIYINRKKKLHKLLYSNQKNEDTKYNTIGIKRMKTQI